MGDTIEAASLMELFVARSDDAEACVGSCEPIAWVGDQAKREDPVAVPMAAVDGLLSENASDGMEVRLRDDMGRREGEEDAEEEDAE